MRNIEDEFKEILKEKHTSGKKSMVNPLFSREGSDSPQSTSRKTGSKWLLTNLVDKFSIDTVGGKSEEPPNKPFTLIEKDIYEQMITTAVKEEVNAVLTEQTLCDYINDFVEKLAIRQSKSEIRALTTTSIISRNVYNQLNANVTNELFKSQLIMSREICMELYKKWLSCSVNTITKETCKPIYESLYQKVTSKELVSATVADEIIDLTVKQYTTKYYLELNEYSQLLDKLIRNALEKIAQTSLHLTTDSKHVTSSMISIYAETVIQDLLDTYSVNSTILATVLAELINKLLLEAKTSNEIYEELVKGVIKQTAHDEVKEHGSYSAKLAYVITNEYFSKLTGRAIKKMYYDLIIANSVLTKWTKSISNAEAKRISSHCYFDACLANGLFSENIKQSLSQLISETIDDINFSKEYKAETAKVVLDSVMHTTIKPFLQEASADSLKNHEKTLKDRKIFKDISNGFISSQIHNYIESIILDSLAISETVQASIEYFEENIIKTSYHYKLSTTNDSSLIFDKMMQSILYRQVQTSLSSYNVSLELAKFFYKEWFDDSLCIQYLALLAYNCINDYPVISPIVDNFISKAISETICEAHKAYTEKFKVKGLQKSVAEDILDEMVKTVIMRGLRAEKFKKTMTAAIDKALMRLYTKKIVRSTYLTFSASEQIASELLDYCMSEMLEKACKKSVTTFSVVNPLISRIVRRMVKSCASEEITSQFENLEIPAEIETIEAVNEVKFASISATKALKARFRNKAPSKPQEENKEDVETKINETNMSLFQLSSKIGSLKSQPLSGEPSLSPIYDEMYKLCLEAIKQNTVIHCKTK